MCVFFQTLLKQFHKGHVDSVRGLTNQADCGGTMRECHFSTSAGAFFGFHIVPLIESTLLQ